MRLIKQSLKDFYYSRRWEGAANRRLDALCSRDFKKATEIEKEMKQIRKNLVGAKNRLIFTSDT